jgi:phosphoribosylglycinamide formyltransferase 1
MGKRPATLQMGFLRSDASKGQNMQRKRRVGVLISGRGSNMLALLAACRDPNYPAEIVAVISNRRDAVGLAHAQVAGVPVMTVPHASFPTREAFETALHEKLIAHRVELLCNAGFMRILSPQFVASWRDRHLNIHPSLLPAFRGLLTHERVLAAGVRITGCSVHMVRAEMDAGPIIAQAAVPVSPDDTVDSLAARVLAAEHVLYPYALRLLASDLIQIQNEQTVYLSHTNTGPQAFAPLISPAVQL